MIEDGAAFGSELDTCATDAALYSLGALPPETAGAVELRLRGGCPYCAAEAETFAAVADHLSLSLTPVEPPPELRGRLLERLQPRRVTAESEHMTIVRRDDAPWAALFPGVEIRPLLGNKTMLIRMQPGAVFPEHHHPGAEQCYVLDGSITDSGGVTLTAGDFVVMSGGIEHQPLRSETGCTLFIAYTR